MLVRHNISITNEVAEAELQRAENMSKYIENVILFYKEHTTKEFAEVKDLYHLEEKFEILNQNYIELKDQLDSLVNSLFGLEE